MKPVNLKTLVRQIEGLDPEDARSLLALLAERSRVQMPPARKLADYFGLGKGRGFRSVQDVDAFIREERASWEN